MSSDPRDRVGDNPTGRPRKSSAGRRRRVAKREAGFIYAWRFVVTGTPSVRGDIRYAAVDVSPESYHDPEVRLLVEDIAWKRLLRDAPEVEIESERWLPLKGGSASDE